VNTYRYVLLYNFTIHNFPAQCHKRKVPRLSKVAAYETGIIGLNENATFLFFIDGSSPMAEKKAISDHKETGNYMNVTIQFQLSIKLCGF
jgi:hypothetical protein